MAPSVTNLGTFVGIVVVSLASGYYLGRVNVSSGLAKKEQAKDILRKCKVQAQKERDAEGEDYEDDNESCDDGSDEDEDEVEINSLSLNDIPGEVKMALVIRQDLAMKKGKIAAQCCHAALACYRLIATDPSRDSFNLQMTQRWLHHGQAKITLKCPDKETMDELFAMALSLGVNSYVVHDAGRTQIAAGSATVLGLGPAPKAVMDQITGELKLY
ncbi:LANO_0F11034g1_1 [Lachancea nothofagi CBS 11611]|uniref:peptidyl-tRNA hydrolase n=1 Tax=Lachancea nothofagi CBS 11611 TaxID=1266666 RepID=A0A1G4KAN0_9SACH|nr:LANO_0F11034g1_1 [Lachancea nothofagi CBS 11611]